MKSLFDALGIDEPAADGSSPTPLEKSIEDLADLTGREFCEGIVNSRQYRQSIIHRVVTSSLPPAVECRILDHAWGKPPTLMEHTGKNGGPIESVTKVEHVIVDVLPTEDDDTETVNYTIQ